MKKCILLFSFFFILLTCYAFATGSTTLTTYYPPPTAAYNTVKMATNYISSNSSTAAAFCTGSNSGTTYYDTGTQVLSVCGTTHGASSPVNGAVYGDSTGTLHIIMNGQNVIYPQQSYNAFCSYSSSAYPSIYSPGNPCEKYATGESSPCANGFTQEPVSASANSTFYDQFQLNQSGPITYVVSAVCSTSNSLGSCPGGIQCGSSACKVGYACSTLGGDHYCQLGQVACTDGCCSSACQASGLCNGSSA